MNHPSVVLTADDFNFFMKKYWYVRVLLIDGGVIIVTMTTVLEKITHPTTWNHNVKLVR